MSLPLIGISLVVVWAGIHFVALPYAARTPGGIRRARWVAVVRYARLVLSIAACTYGATVIWLAVVLSRPAFEDSVAPGVVALHLALSPWRLASGILIVVATIALALRVRRDARDAYIRGIETSLLDAAVDGEADAYGDLRARGDDETGALVRAVDQREHVVRRLAAASVPLPRELAEELRALYRRLAERVPDALARASGSPLRAPPLSPWIAAATACLGVLGAAVLADRMSFSSPRWTATAIGAAEKEARREFYGLFAAARLPAARRLSTPEEAAVDSLALSFARSLQKSHALVPVNQLPLDDVEYIRRAGVRSRVLHILLGDDRSTLRSVRSLNASARRTAARIDGAPAFAHDPLVERGRDRLRLWLSTISPPQAALITARSVHPQPEAGTERVKAAVAGEAISAAFRERAKSSPIFETYLDLALERFLVTTEHRGVDAAMAQTSDLSSEASRYGALLFGDVHERYADLAGWQNLVSESIAHPPAAPSRDGPLPAWALLESPEGRLQWATGFADISPAGYGDDLRSPRAVAEWRQRRTGPAPPPPSATAPPDVVDALRRTRGSIPAVSALRSRGSRIADDVVVGTFAQVVGEMRGSRRSAPRDASVVPAQPPPLSASSSSASDRGDGGVLIGAPPAHPSQVDCRDIDWSVRGGRVLLRLTGPNCPWAATPIDTATAASALAYAADGRPAATTGVASSPLLDGRSVHVHPVLVDTPIGREATKIDMFIDTFFRNGAIANPRYTAAAAAVDDQITLYHVGLAMRDHAMATRLADLLPPRVLTSINKEASWIEKSYNDRTVTSALTRVNRPAARRTRPSILRAKSAYFDTDLVDLVESCQRSAPSPSKYRSCIAARLREADYTDNDKMMSWLSAQVVDYHLESGVREVPYETSQALHLGDDSAAPDNGLQPFRFEIYVAFYSTPTMKSTDEATKQDEQPYDLFEIEPAMRATIAKTARTHRNVAVTLRAMAAFTRAQRVFRLALAGNLGPMFPVDRLEALARDLSSFPRPHERTIRWLARPTIYAANAAAAAEVAAEIDGSDKSNRGTVQLARLIARGLTACTNGATRNARLSRRYVFDAPECDARRYSKRVAALSHCTSEACFLIQKEYDLLRIMRLRNDLHVAEDDTDADDPTLSPS